MQNQKEFIEKFGLSVDNKDVKERFDTKMLELASHQISWEKTIDLEFPYQANIANKTWALRINDWPDYPMWTLLIDDKAIITFDDTDWPETWKNPHNH